MKKILAMMLTAAMMLSMGTAASATLEDTDVETSKPTTLTTVFKAYDVKGSTDNDLYPTETLSFTSVADETNPDKGATNITIDDLVVAGNNNQHLTINVPAYTEVGTYHYTVSETAGNAQGVTYTEDDIYVSVMVTYDYEDTDNDGYLRTAVVGVTLPTVEEGETAEKNYEFTNIYEVGHLTVNKTVTGNLADTSKYFKIKVTFNAEKNVESAITISGGSAHTAHTDDCVEGCTIPVNPTVIENDWIGEKEVEIWLKHTDTLTFNNIPKGVTYEVEEDAAHFEGDANGSEGYTATYTNETGTIAVNETSAATIVNTKTTEVDTGISVDSIPYIAMLGVVALGGTGFMVSKKRRSED